MITIANKENCTGCYACANICPKGCISMESDQEGFWYTEVDYSQCIECGRCIKACPIIQMPLQGPNEQKTPLAYAIYNKDESVRLDSSSGGLFTLIAEEVIGAGGVVFGALYISNEYLLSSSNWARYALFLEKHSKTSASIDCAMFCWFDCCV